jgi:hypothetical protein
MVMSAPRSLMLPVPETMVPPLGSAVVGSAGGANTIGGVAIVGRVVGGAAKAEAQNTAMQNAATRFVSAAGIQRFFA